jgi:hypothetical protein
VADQRGVVRSGGVNIGAYQASTSALVLTSLAHTAVIRRWHLAKRGAMYLALIALGVAAWAICVLAS